MPDGTRKICLAREDEPRQRYLVVPSVISSDSRVEAAANGTIYKLASGETLGGVSGQPVALSSNGSIVVLIVNSKSGVNLEAVC